MPKKLIVFGGIFVVAALVACVVFRFTPPAPIILHRIAGPIFRVKYSEITVPEVHLIPNEIRPGFSAFGGSPRSELRERALPEYPYPICTPFLHRIRFSKSADIAAPESRYPLERGCAISILYLVSTLVYGPLYHLASTNIRITPDLTWRLPHDLKRADKAFRDVRDVYYGGADNIFTPGDRLIVLSDPEFARDTSDLIGRYYDTKPGAEYDGVSVIDHFYDAKLKWEVTKTYFRGLWRQASASLPRQ